MAEIRFENVLKRYRDNIVIPGMSLTIRDGEFFTFVGPSGCGKSTMLNMIAGLEPVSEGKLWFDDLLVNDLSPRDRDIAMVFQSYALYPHMSVYENIAFPLRMQKIAKSTVDEEVRRVAGLLGLQELLKRKPKELSGGQRQRVALGRAIVRRPKVFLMDEPLSNLDARLRIDMREELKSLHQQLGITTIYVTHEQAEAMSLSDRIAVMNRGVIQQCAPPSEIYLKPANVFVAGFMGSMPINLIPAKVTSRSPFTVECGGVLLQPQVRGAPQGDSVTVGMRPEDLNVFPTRTPGSTAIRISLIEPAGSFFWIDFHWHG
ncbi:MAG TPA: ABC transporter ATP-binding protein, partial [Verrucomicrobiae bacterium]|nr:ABC transporter ATP-binding protein [Verrucomicrobiae bacterium]